jgi:hypothetical protein
VTRDIIIIIIIRVKVEINLEQAKKAEMESRK